jgi:uncharacterized protein (TIGR00255 family)
MAEDWRLGHYPSMKSMTGYGRGEGSRNGLKITVEVSSVNRKQTEVAVNLPRDLEVLEAQVRDEINRRVSRGRITVRVAIQNTAGVAGKTRVDLALAKSYVRDLRGLGKDLGLDDGITLDLLARLPGVVQPAEDISEAEELWPATDAALKGALEMMLQMRAREGSFLARDLKNRVALMRRGVARIRRLVPGVVKHYREQLLQRIRDAGLPASGLEEERLMKEIFFFADRSDITEELTRLQSHFQQFDDCLKSAEPVGRTLDFLSQEMNREINTLGAKANNSLISREIVQLKAELEKFREQVQNVE